MSIPLPPVPLPSIDAWPNTPEKLRARDQEIVRCVLEAAAKKARHSSEWLADAIRALEFHHE